MGLKTASPKTEDPRIIGANPAGGNTNSNLALPALYDVIGRFDIAR